MSSPRWFATVTIEQAPLGTQEAASRLVELLDRLQPTRLDHRQSHAVFDQGTVEVLLAHADDVEANIEIQIGDGSADVYGVYGHDEIYSTTVETSDQWISDLIDQVQQLLTGRYSIEKVYWRGRHIRTRVRDVVGNVRNTVSAEGFRTLLIPVPRRFLVVKTSWQDFGCQPAASD